MRSRVVFVPVVVLALSTCIFRYGQVVEPAPPPTGSRNVASPTKAFLSDGSVVVFPVGMVLGADSIRGTGNRYPLGLGSSEAVSAVALADVIGIEAFEGGTNVGASVLATTLGVGGGAVVTVAILKALFGSCPTFYALQGTDTVLQAEAFSYSIAPLFEARDVDGLRLATDAGGIARLEMRNEALETHYVNHLEIIEARHRVGERVVPDERGVPIAVPEGVAPVVARDRDGRSVLGELTDHDGRAFASTEARLASVTEEDARDWIELEFPHPGTDSAAVVVRLRNSLLNTVLFYDVMLASTGGAALDWLARDLQRIGPAVELGSWFQETMGLRVQVHDGSAWRAVGRITDTGPIAWKDVAIRVPAPEGEHVRIRLDFLVDEWRIDRVELAARAREVSVRRLPLARILDRAGVPDDRALNDLAEPDTDYMVTYPGHVSTLEFDVGPDPDQEERTFLLSSQGYYSEWLRPDWVRPDPTRTAFRPGPDAVRTTVALWRQKRDDFEARFHASRVPVR